MSTELFHEAFVLRGQAAKLDLNFIDELETTVVPWTKGIFRVSPPSPSDEVPAAAALTSSLMQHFPDNYLVIAPNEHTRYNLLKQVTELLPKDQVFRRKDNAGLSLNLEETKQEASLYIALPERQRKPVYGKVCVVLDALNIGNDIWEKLRMDSGNTVVMCSAPHWTSALAARHPF